MEEIKKFPLSLEQLGYTHCGHPSWCRVKQVVGFSGPPIYVRTEIRCGLCWATLDEKTGEWRGGTVLATPHPAIWNKLPPKFWGRGREG